MSLHKDEALVLFKRAYMESDKIVRLLTLSSGKISAIAKGGSKSHKRFMNTLEPFNRVRVEYFEKHGKGMVRIENADIIETNRGIEASLKKACIAGFFTEFVDRLTKEREKHPALFYLLWEVLARAKSVDFTYSDILYYQLKVLETLGYMPNFVSCVYCGRDMSGDLRIFFSRERGGTLCGACAKSLPHKVYAQGVIEGLISVREQEWDSEKGVGYTDCFHDEGQVYGRGMFESAARDIMEDFISFHLEVEFKSYRLLKGLPW
jgi:DNA repair protein RecO (recombination protein O)